MRISTRLLAMCASIAVLAACGKKVDDKSRDPAPTGGSGAAGMSSSASPAQGPAPGVDATRKVISLGALNDESGPAKAIGVAFANGKRLAVKAVQTGAIKLPDGWTIELVEKDHAYNPQQSVQLYKELSGKVLLLATSFGTLTTLPLRDDLRRDDMIAFPASLSSEMAKDEHTPPLGPSFQIEAMRAMDWAVEAAGGADKVKAGIVYQRDDYGADGVAGWKAAAEHHKVAIVAEQTVRPGDQDFTAVVKALKDAGATHVMLTVLAGSTSGILGAAAKLAYAPAWVGNSSSWIDVFFDKLPAKLFETYRRVTGLTYWGEDVPGMKEFLEVWKANGAGMGDPNWYILVSYIQGLQQIEVLRRAIEAKTLDRAGVRRALHSITKWDAGGMIQPLDMSKVPYVTSTRTRVLAPDFEKKSWRPVGGYAAPAALPGA
jgi:ABC-type branched-subunit amino acid transport system substrate-binding protein